MRPAELRFGHLELLTLRVVGSAAPTGLRPELPVRLGFGDQPRIPLLRQLELAVPVEGVRGQDRQRLDSLCRLGRPRLCYLLPEGGAAREQLVVQCHTFPMEIETPALRVGVDEKALRSAQHSLRNRQLTVDELIRRLTEECLLEVAGEAGPSWYAFASAGQGEPRLDQALVLHGRSLRVHVSSTPAADGGHQHRVAKVVADRRLSQKQPIFLLKGSAGASFGFCDASAAGKVRAELSAELAALQGTEAGFLAIWRRYGQAEADAILDRAREIGVLRFRQRELEEQGWRFDFEPVDGLEDRLRRLGQEDRLEWCSSPPAVIVDPTQGWTEYLKALKDEQGSEPPFTGQVVRVEPDRRSVLLLEKNDQPVPEQGSFVLSLRGHARVIERRDRAEQAILTCSAEMPQLGLLLEGRPVPVATLPEEEPITPRVLTRVFKNHPPTPNQVEAIRLALQTPDLFIIQGPPGTGKTTVIHAIVERLHERLGLQDAPGQVLVASFQHDAVVNAIGRMELDGLPPIKFGQKGARGEETSPFDEDATRQRLEQLCEDWRRRLIEQVPSAAEDARHREVCELLDAYVLTPGTRTEAADLLERIARLTLGQIPGGLTDELHREAGRLRDWASCSPELRAERAALVRAVRALRGTPVTFADDGPQQAARLLALQARGPQRLLTAAERSLLAAAAGWTGRAAPPWVEDLARLRLRLLLSLSPGLGDASQQPELLESVISLLGAVRDELQQRHRASLQGIPHVVAGLLVELEDPDFVRETILRYVLVYAATVQQAASKPIAKAKTKGEGRVSYDTVIVDEAARANPLDLFIPMTQARSRIVLVGDQNQLEHLLERELLRLLDADFPPVKLGGRSLGEVLQESLFGKLFAQLADWKPRRTIMLSDQFRMHPRLGEFVSRAFYQGKLASPLAADQFAHNLPGLNGAAAAWLRVGRREHGSDERRGTSWARPAEARRLVELLHRWLGCPEAQSFSFGVITFYAAQLRALQRELQQAGVLVPAVEGWQVAPGLCGVRLPADRLRVGTVDAFQGREFDIVLLSMVRSNKRPDRTQEERWKRYGHLMSSHRLCVSMSRQRRLLVVAGDDELLRGAHAADAIGPLVDFWTLCNEERGFGTLL